MCVRKQVVEYVSHTLQTTPGREINLFSITSIIDPNPSTINSVLPAEQEFPSNSGFSVLVWNSSYKKFLLWGLCCPSSPASPGKSAPCPSKQITATEQNNRIQLILCQGVLQSSQVIHSLLQSLMRNVHLCRTQQISVCELIFSLKKGSVFLAWEHLCRFLSYKVEPVGFGWSRVFMAHCGRCCSLLGCGETREGCMAEYISLQWISNSSSVDYSRLVMFLFSLKSQGSA